MHELFEDIEHPEGVCVVRQSIESCRKKEIAETRLRGTKVVGGLVGEGARSRGAVKTWKLFRSEGV